MPSEAREIEHGEVVIGDTGLPMMQVVPTYKYELGLPLVKNLSALTTQVWKLHNWYMATAKEGRFYIMAGVKEEHYFHEYVVHIDFSALFEMYNQQAIDKAIVGCYCL